VTQPVLGSPPSTRQTPDTPADALAAVLENTAALARAEVRLAAAEARAWLLRMSLGLVLLWLSLLLIQVSVLVLAIAPVVQGSTPWGRVLAMLGLALLPTLAVVILAVRELGRSKQLMKDLGHANLDQPSQPEH
jgi:hypothetical protein